MFAQLFSDIGTLWAKYGTVYLTGISNTLILAITATLIGCVIGYLIAYLNVVPMICTLAMLNITRGLAYVVTGGQPVYGLANPYAFLGASRLLKTEGMPNGILPYTQTPSESSGESDPAEIPTVPNAAQPLSLVECTILTGRTHQIRVHMASSIGCPIVGDAVYGRPGWDKRLAPPPERQLLHARRLSLAHPVTRQPLVLEAPIPADFLPYLPAEL